jgi:hypothetical protein
LFLKEAYLYLPKSNYLFSRVVDDLIQKAIKDENVREEGILKGLLESQKISYKTKRLLLLEIIMGASDTVSKEV